MLKSVGVALATDLLLFVPLLAKNYKKTSKFLEQNQDKL
jgi:hypothetical protein